METKKDFHDELLSLHSRTGEATGGDYWPNYFLRSVRNNGGLAAAKKFLSPKKKSAGFDRLVTAHRADLSVEAIVLEERFSHLFTKAELEVARSRIATLPENAFPVKVGALDERLPDEVPSDKKHIEGAVKNVKINRYERNPKARAACIKHFGAWCRVCKFDFEKCYGEIGEGFIHVHHKRPLHKLKASYRVNPTKDLVPVCPNCHAMLHTSEPPMDVEQLQAKLRQGAHHVANHDNCPPASICATL